MTGEKKSGTLGAKHAGLKGGGYFTQFGLLSTQRFESWNSPW